jgi:hypothetical protein
MNIELQLLPTVLRPKKKGKNHIVLFFTHAEHSIFPTASILCTQKKTKIEEEKYLPKPSVPSLMM